MSPAASRHRGAWATVSYPSASPTAPVHCWQLCNLPPTTIETSHGIQACCSGSGPGPTWVLLVCAAAAPAAAAAC